MSFDKSNRHTYVINRFWIGGPAKTISCNMKISVEPILCHLILLGYYKDELGDKLSHRTVDNRLIRSTLNSVLSL